MPYLGNTPTTQSFISGTDYFNGTGSQTAFTLTRTVNSVNDIEAVVNNVVQQPNSAYTLSGTTLTFTSAPSSGTSNIYVRYLSTTMQSFTVPANSITRNQLDSNLQSVAVGRNRIINGAMVIDQRNAGASVTQGTINTYTVDRWLCNGASTSKFTVQQNAGSVTPPVGHTNYLGVTSSASTSLAAGDFYYLMQGIEGFNVADLGWGTANAKTVTLSFWVRSSLTGTFGGAVRNLIDSATRSYPFTFTINSANTWEQKSVIIAGDVTGTWATNNTCSLAVCFSMGTGSTFSGTAGAWAGSNLISATGATSVVGTNGATFYITGVQLERGTQATSFEYRQYGAELALCQRYCVAFSSVGSSSVGLGAAANASTGQIFIPLPVAGRVAPTGIVSSASWIFGNYNAGDGGTGAIVFANSTTSGITVNSAGGGSGMTAGFAGILYSSSGTSTFYTTGQEL